MKKIAPHFSLDLSVFNERINSTTRLKPLILSGKPHCSWCGINELIPPKRKFCSEDCSISAFSHLNPQSNYSLLEIMPRQANHCNICQFDWSESVEESATNTINYLDQILKTIDSKYRNKISQERDVLKIDRISFRSIDLLKSIISKKDPTRAIEIDHVVAVALGGNTIGTENLQAICRKCHLDKTKNDMLLIRSKRK